MNASNYQGTGALRSGSRLLIIFTLAIAMFATTAFAPVRATEGSGDDLESVRATVLEVYNYKIGLLADKSSGTENADAKAIYAEGIAELTGLRNSRVAVETSIAELWALKERAYAIYGETVAAAERAGMTDAELLELARNKARGAVEYKMGLLKEWLKGCDVQRAEEIVADGTEALRSLFAKIDSAATSDDAYVVKDEASSIYHSTIDKAEETCRDDDTRTEEDEAAAELNEARWSTLSLIERKTAILVAAAEAAGNRAVAEIFAEAAEGIAGREGAARSARSVRALKEIRSTVMDIYIRARDAVADLRGDGDADDRDKDPARRIEAHLGKIADHVDHLTEIAFATADDSPETYAAVLAANEKVHEAIGAVLDVAESGKKLDTRWEELSHALESFKHAFVTHYISLADGPFSFGKLHIPG
ncbi:MAG: hypothetical protein BMS9Abin12_1268 [Acidimicrobiia bacterium]|nr:MAG: hypothetical protein BMS9Abin12_1268 [Acidimicrobiia bacterium]